MQIKIHLTDAEYNLLNNLTSQTKTDCWFCLDVDKDGFDCVLDLESGYKISLRHAVQELNEALIPDLLDVSIGDMCVYGNLLHKLEIDFNPFAEEMEIYENIYAGNGNGIFTEEETKCQNIQT